MRQPVPEHERETRPEPAAPQVEPDAPASAPGVLSAHAVLALQRSHGNQAVARLLSRPTLHRVIVGEGTDRGQKRKREDDAGPQPKRQMIQVPPEGMGVDAPAVQNPDEVELDEPGVPVEVGDWQRTQNTPKMRYWKHSSGLWHFTQFRQTGDYHMKGNGKNKAYRRGYFDGAWEFTWVHWEGVTGQTRKSVGANKRELAEPIYQSCMASLLPLLAGQKPARDGPPTTPPPKPKPKTAQVPEGTSENPTGRNEPAAVRRPRDRNR